MSEQKELSRDSELYQDAIKTKVINDVDYESRITEISEARHSYKYRCKLTWCNLSERGVKENLSRSDLLELKSMNPIERAEEFGKTHSHQWKAKGDVEMSIEIKIKVELPDGEEITKFIKENIQTFKDMKRIGSIASAAKSNQSVDVTFTDEDSYTISTQEATFECQDSLSYYDGFSISEYKTNGTEKLLAFFATEERWSEATVQKPIEEDEKIIIPVELNGETIEFVYELPDSEFWDIAEELGNGDPLLVDGSQVYVTHTIINENGLFDDHIWVVRSEKPTNPKTLLTRLKNYIF